MLLGLLVFRGTARTWVLVKGNSSLVALFRTALRVQSAAVAVPPPVLTTVLVIRKPAQPAPVSHSVSMIAIGMMPTWPSRACTSVDCGANADDSLVSGLTEDGEVDGVTVGGTDGVGSIVGDGVGSTEGAVSAVGVTVGGIVAVGSSPEVSTTVPV